MFSSRDEVKELTHHLQRKNRELELIHEIEHIRTTYAGVPLVIDNILNEICKMLNIRLYFGFVYNDKTRKLELEATNDKGVFKKTNYDIIRLLARDAVEKLAPIVINSTEKHPKLRYYRIKNLMVYPIIFKDKINAVFIFINKMKSFNEHNLLLLKNVTTHINSTLKQLSIYKDIEMKNKELEVLYKIDRLRDTIKDFETLLNSILDELSTTIDAKIAFIMLFDNKRTKTEIKISDKIKMTGFLKNNEEQIEKLCLQILDSGDMKDFKYVTSDIKNFVGIPVVLRKDSIAVFGAINSNKEDFTEHDKKLLTAIATQADSAIFEDIEKEKIKGVFKRYVSDDVVEKILSDVNTDYFKGERHEMTVLFSDIRGFTSMAEQKEPEEIVSMLNEHFSAMTDTILKNKGTIDKFIGDEVMAVFGAPVFYNDHALRAVKTALEMQEAQKKLQIKWKKEGKHPLSIGIGINTGEMISGNIGSEKRADYTVIGDNVNLASRLKAIAEPGQILITEATYRHIKDKISAKKLAPVSVKGREGKINIYDVVSLK